MGMIYKRGEVFWIKYYRNGKPYRESSESKKEADAKRLLKKREGEISDGKLPGVYFDKVIYDELRAELLIDYELRGRKSLRRLKNSLDHLDTEFEKVKAVNIDSAKIKKYIEKRQSEGAKNGTINRELSALIRMFSLGLQCSPPKVHAAPFIPKLKEAPPRQGFVEPGDFLRVRDNLPDYLKVLCTFGYRTGCREEEILSLELNQVDLNEGVVELTETKNGEPRTIYLDDELKELFQRQLEARKNSKKVLPYVFLNKNGTDRIKTFLKAWKAACTAAGIGPRLFHDCRRSAVRNLVRSGVPETVAMRISGHKTRSVFERYNIVSNADLIIAAQRQEAYLKSQMGTVSGTVVNFEQKKEATR
jgi:integrase